MQMPPPLPIAVPDLALLPLVVGKNSAQGWRVALLRGGLLLAELEPVTARVLGRALMDMADVLEGGARP